MYFTLFSFFAYNTLSLNIFPGALCTFLKFNGRDTFYFGFEGEVTREFLPEAPCLIDSCAVKV